MEIDTRETGVHSTPLTIFAKGEHGTKIQFSPLLDQKVIRNKL